MIREFFNSFFSPSDAGVLVLGTGKLDVSRRLADWTVVHNAAEAMQAVQIANQHQVDLFFTYVARQDNGKMRKGRNFAYGRALALDIDVRLDKPNCPDTLAQAGQELLAYVKSGKLPAPTWLVHSGGGLHCYWVLDQVMPANTWPVIANGFANYLQAECPKIAGDVARTRDGGFLRVPTSVNRKYTKHGGHQQVSILNKGPVLPIKDLREFVRRGKSAPPTNAGNRSDNVPSLGPVPAHITPSPTQQQQTARPMPRQPWTVEDLRSGCRLFGLREKLREADMAVDSYEWWYKTGMLLTYASDKDGREASEAGFRAFVETSLLRGADGTRYWQEYATKQEFVQSLLSKYQNFCQSRTAGYGVMTCEAYQEGARAALLAAFKDSKQVEGTLKKVCGSCTSCSPATAGGNVVAMRPPNINHAAMNAWRRRKIQTAEVEAKEPVKQVHKPALRTVVAPEAPAPEVDGIKICQVGAALAEYESDPRIQRLASQINPVSLDAVQPIAESASLPFRDWIAAHPRHGDLLVLRPNGPNGGLFGRSKKESHWLHLASQQTWPVRVVRDHTTRALLRVDMAVWDNALQLYRIVHLPSEDLISVGTLHKSAWAMAAGLTKNTQRAHPISLFMTAVIEYVNHLTSAKTQALSLGFDDTSDPKEFTCGKRTVTAKGEHLSVLEGEVAQQVEATNVGKYSGEPAKAMALFKFYTRYGSRAAKWFMLNGLSSVLRRMVGRDLGGMVVQLTGGNGTGKTSMLQVAQSFWGGSLSVSASSTHKGIRQVLGAYSTMPVTIDEFTAFPAKARRELAYHITDSAPRTVADQRGVGTHTGAVGFYSSLLLTSNTPFMDLISVRDAEDSPDVLQAQRRRLIDLNIGTEPTLISKYTYSGLDNLVQCRVDNNGYIGPLFVQAVLSNPSRVRTLLRQTLERLRKYYAKKIKSMSLDQMNFWLATAACQVVTGQIMKSLGLWDETEETLTMFMHQIHDTVLRQQEAEFDALVDNSFSTVNAAVGFLQNGPEARTVVTRTWADAKSIVASGKDALAVSISNLDAVSCIIVKDPQAMRADGFDVVQEAAIITVEALRKYFRAVHGKATLADKWIADTMRLPKGPILSLRHVLMPGMHTPVDACLVADWVLNNPNPEALDSQVRKTEAYLRKARNSGWGLDP